MDGCFYLGFAVRISHTCLQERKKKQKKQRKKKGKHKGKKQGDKEKVEKQQTAAEIR